MRVSISLSIFHFYSQDRFRLYDESVLFPLKPDWESDYTNFPLTRFLFAVASRIFCLCSSVSVFFGEFFFFSSVASCSIPFFITGISGTIRESISFLVIRFSTDAMIYATIDMMTRLDTNIDTSGLIQYFWSIIDDIVVIPDIPIRSRKWENSSIMRN